VKRKGTWRFLRWGLVCWYMGVGNNSNKFNEYILVLVWPIIFGGSNILIPGDNKV
jgi:hypothetical protein